MKSIFALTLIALCVCLATAAPNVRQKRAVYIEKCPERSTLEECSAYAKTKLGQSTSCQGYTVNGNAIQWATCGAIACRDPVKLAKGDLSKTYPDCCDTCDGSSITGPAEISAVL